MLNPFPGLLVYSLLAPTILRVVAGLIFIALGRALFSGEKASWNLSLSKLNVPNPKLVTNILGVVEILGGAMLVVGFYTQVTSLVLGLLVFLESYIEYNDPNILKRNFAFYLLLLAILLSLLFSSAGAFAIDLPL